ncbi:MAG: hypothetical protein ACRDCE_00270 [Cetobacterium sp.]|uniref:hypothetical protein n=1 Tax=Cetobacterium sp. TaxID=2071632 RepID=UPI003EE46F36
MNVSLICKNYDGVVKDYQKHVQAGILLNSFHLTEPTKLSKFIQESFDNNFLVGYTQHQWMGIPLDVAPNVNDFDGLEKLPKFFRLDANEVIKAIVGLTPSKSIVKFSVPGEVKVDMFFQLRKGRVNMSVRFHDEIDIMDAFLVSITASQIMNACNVEFGILSFYATQITQKFVPEFVL